MNIRQLEYFLAVAEELNFTKAAEKFYISQTAMTQQIKSLEKQLEVTLFTRTNKHVELTLAGKVFEEEAKALISRTNEAILRTQSAAKGIAGNLSIGFIQKYENGELNHILQNFHNLYPNITFSLFRDNPAALFNAVLTHKYDLIFSIDFGYKESPQIASLQIKGYPLYVVLYPSHPLAYKQSIQRCELKNESFIFNEFQTDALDGSDQILHNYLDAGFMPQIISQSKDIESILLMVASGMGIALLPEYAITTSSNLPNLMYIPLEGSNEFVNIKAFWNQENINPSMQKFLESITDFRHGNQK